SESRDGVPLTNLDDPLFDESGATKRDLVDYLDAVADRIIPVLEQRPLSVIRVHRVQEAFMQKNVPKYTPDWVPTVEYWAESSKARSRPVARRACTSSYRSTPTRRWETPRPRPARSQSGPRASTPTSRPRRS